MDWQDATDFRLAVQLLSSNITRLLTVYHPRCYCNRRHLSNCQQERQQLQCRE